MVKFRYGSDASRAIVVLQEGEPGFTTDTHQFFIGDGVTPGGLLMSSGMLDVLDGGNIGDGTSSVTLVDGGTF
jgi:hypothetical protein